VPGLGEGVCVGTIGTNAHADGVLRTRPPGYSYLGRLTLRDSTGRCNVIYEHKETTALSGTFEILQAGEGTFLFQLTAGDGTVVAVSPRFKTIKEVVDGIAAVRENAAMGLVVNRSPLHR
jgi:uncharacterized protein YegP (UPF0339 family)